MSNKIEVQNVSLTRIIDSKPKAVLDNISVEIPAGKIFNIVGPSGAGKSTFLRLLNRLQDPDSGVISLDGVDISKTNVISLRRRVGMIFQNPVVFEGTVLENITYGPNLQHLTIDPVALIQSVGLSADFLQRKAKDLSGGEQQRVCIARTLANDPEVILMDEPTASLDPTSRAQIGELINELNRDRQITIVIVTHYMDQARNLGYMTMLLVDGKKVEEDFTEAFFANPKTTVARQFIEGELE